MEPIIRINLFKNGGRELYREIMRQRIPIYETRAEPGAAMATGDFIQVVTAVGGSSLIPAIALVIYQWLKNQGSRKVIIQTRDKTIVHAEGLSIDALERVLENAESLSAIQTEQDPSTE